jgi:hypothetical protein
LEINGSIELGWDSSRTEVAHFSLMTAVFLTFVLSLIQDINATAIFSQTE